MMVVGRGTPLLLFYHGSQLELDRACMKTSSLSVSPPEKTIGYVVGVGMRKPGITA